MEIVWNLKCVITTVIIGAIAVMKRSLKKSFQTIHGKKFRKSSTKDGYPWNITRNAKSTAV